MDEDRNAGEEIILKWVRITGAVAIILLLVVLVQAKNNWDEQIEQHAERASELKQETGSVVAEAQAEAERPKEESETVPDTENAFYQMLEAQEISTVKLIGDGITAGYGHPEYTSPDEGRIIFSGNGETFREAGTEFGSWANRLREYASKPEFGTVDVVNAGIRDKTADWTLRNIDGLLKSDENAVIMMIGTDDRIFSTLDQYESNMRELLAIADERSDILVVMSPPPSKEDIQPYNFTMEEIDAVLQKISEEQGYPFISHFDGIQQQIAEGAAYESLMQTTAANPVAGGYEVMWEEIQKGLGLQ